MPEPLFYLAETTRAAGWFAEMQEVAGGPAGDSVMVRRETQELV